MFTEVVLPEKYIKPYVEIVSSQMCDKNMVFMYSAMLGPWWILIRSVQSPLYR